MVRSSKGRDRGIVLVRGAGSASEISAPITGTPMIHNGSSAMPKIEVMSFAPFGGRYGGFRAGRVERDACPCRDQ